jgi:hypothetical protein
MLCFLCDTDWNLIYYSNELRLQRAEFRGRREVSLFVIGVTGPTCTTSEAIKVFIKHVKCFCFLLSPLFISYPRLSFHCQRPALWPVTSTEWERKEVAAVECDETFYYSTVSSWTNMKTTDHANSYLVLQPLSLPPPLPVPPPPHVSIIWCSVFETIYLNATFLFSKRVNKWK